VSWSPGNVPLIQGSSLHEVADARIDHLVVTDLAEGARVEVLTAVQGG
jgi:hypothetical protein